MHKVHPRGLEDKCRGWPPSFSPLYLRVTLCWCRSGLPLVMQMDGGVNTGPIVHRAWKRLPHSQTLSYARVSASWGHLVLDLTYRSFSNWWRKKRFKTHGHSTVLWWRADNLLHDMLTRSRCFLSVRWGEKEAKKRQCQWSRVPKLEMHSAGKRAGAAGGSGAVVGVFAWQRLPIRE